MTVRVRSELVGVLGGVPLFAGLTKHQLREVAKACSEVHYDDGATILKELEQGQNMVAILTGTARVVRNGRTIAKVGPGDVVGEMSLIDGRPRSASVVADDPVDGIVLYRTTFRKLLEDMPSLCAKLLLAQTARLREVDKRAAALG